MSGQLITQSPELFRWLVVTTILFSIGLYGLLTRRNAIGVLMAVELMLNAAAVNFVVYNRYVAGDTVSGEIMALFIIAVAAAEVVVAIAIFISLFKLTKTADVSRVNVMRG